MSWVAFIRVLHRLHLAHKASSLPSYFILTCSACSVFAVRLEDSEGGFASDKRNMLRCLVSLLLKLRFASVSSFIIATAESVRLTNFHIHLVRGDRKSFSCISSSALLVHSVFPTVHVPSAGEEFQLHHVSSLLVLAVFATVLRHSTS